jgi:hypothetical protein
MARDSMPPEMFRALNPFCRMAPIEQPGTEPAVTQGSRVRTTPQSSGTVLSWLIASVMLTEPIPEV